jgi:hypothetical protein
VNFVFCVTKYSLPYKEVSLYLMLCLILWCRARASPSYCIKLQFEDSSLLGHEAVCLGDLFPTFRTVVVPSESRGEKESKFVCIDRNLDPTI